MFLTARSTIDFEPLSIAIEKTGLLEPFSVEVLANEETGRKLFAWLYSRAPWSVWDGFWKAAEALGYKKAEDTFQIGSFKNSFTKARARQGKYSLYPPLYIVYTEEGYR